MGKNGRKRSTVLAVVSFMAEVPVGVVVILFVLAAVIVVEMDLAEVLWIARRCA